MVWHCEATQQNGPVPEACNMRRVTLPQLGGRATTTSGLPRPAWVWPNRRTAPMPQNRPSCRPRHSGTGTSTSARPIVSGQRSSCSASKARISSPTICPSLTTEAHHVNLRSHEEKASRRGHQRPDGQLLYPRQRVRQAKMAIEVRVLVYL